MKNTIMRTSVYAFLIGSMLVAEQPAHAKVTETLCHLKDKACSSTGAAIGLGLWCCGVTYWCLKLQKNQRALEEKVKSEQAKRRKLKEELTSLGELVQAHSDALLELEKNVSDLKEKIAPIELALYGADADSAQKDFRLTLLSKFMEKKSSVTVKACGCIETVDSSQSLADSGQESPDSSSPMGEGSVPLSREGSVSPTHERNQTTTAATIIGGSENKSSGCSLM